MTQPIPYDRLKYYLEPDDYIKLVDPEGNWNFYRILKNEPMGQIKVQFADEVNPVLPAAFSDPERVPFEFTEPARQNRLFQLRLTVFAIDRDEGELVDRDIIPPTAEVEWGHPQGTVRGGTDRPANVTMNGIVNANIGGVNGGRIPFNQIYTRDDPNEVFDLWNIFGAYPDFRVLNQGPAILGGPSIPPPEEAALPYDWFLAIQGMKYQLGDVTDEEKEKLLTKELHYRGITIGGIKAVTTKA